MKYPSDVFTDVGGEDDIDDSDDNLRTLDIIIVIRYPIVSSLKGEQNWIIIYWNTICIVQTHLRHVKRVIFTTLF